MATLIRSPQARQYAGDLPLGAMAIQLHRSCSLTITCFEYGRPDVVCQHPAFFNFLLDCSSFASSGSKIANSTICIAPNDLMPSYYQHDCHYFHHTSLRGLSIATLVSPLHS